MENNHSNSPNQNIVFSEKNGNSPSLQSFNAVLESLTPQHEKKVWTKMKSRNFKIIKNVQKITNVFFILLQMSYIESELEALEREQEAIDLKARACEKKLRNVMNGLSTSKSNWNFSSEVKLNLQYEYLILSFHICIRYG